MASARLDISTASCVDNKLGELNALVRSADVELTIGAKGEDAARATGDELLDELIAGLVVD